MKKLLFSFLILTTSLSHAQTLDFNDVKAFIGNVPGRLFQSDSAGGVGIYHVPKGSGLRTIFVSSLWCSALDSTGNIHVSAMRFGAQGRDFFAGPYSTTNSYNDSAFIAEYGTSLWFVEKSKVEYHKANYWQAGYIMDSTIVNWPANGKANLGTAQNLAPFVDINNNGIYEPIQGEYPDIRGDKACYMIMNDVALPHTETYNSIPLGIEVHTMLYQYASNDYLNETTFVNYRVFNRSDTNYSNFRVGVYTDFDLGYSADDLVGTDVTNNMVYVYNGDNLDDFISGYGANPPAAGIMCLNKKIDYSRFFSNGSSYPYSDPFSAYGYYNYMNGFWANGSQFYYGQAGFFGNLPAKYMFPGDSDPLFTGTGGVDPGFDWNENNGGTTPGDRRTVLSLESSDLLSGDSDCYDFAFLYARNAGHDNLQNLTALRNLSSQVQLEFDSNYGGTTDYNCDQVTLGLKELQESQFDLYPNPTSGHFSLSFGNERVDGQVYITDVNGRVVYETEILNEYSIHLNVDLSSGIYQVGVVANGKQLHKKLVITQ